MVKSTVGDICRPGGKEGILIPFSDSERQASDWLRAPIYVMSLVWCFIGVSIGADLFVSSIEAITAVRKKVRLKNGRLLTLKVWNDTVANLSLMALGSSAPEIFLSFIELAKNEMYIGDLGPSTIVGSASFNMLVIVAVCMVAIPEGEERKIKDLNAFYVTAAFSLFAYMWLCGILVSITPDRVDITEAATTLGMLPVLIWISYLIDVGDLRALCFVRIFKGSRHEDMSDHQDDPGALSFTEGDLMSVSRPSTEEEVSIYLSRDDFKEAITCSYRTESFNALPGYDYEHTEGTVEFAKGVDEVQIPVTVLPNKRAQACREFFLIVEDPGLVAGSNQEIFFDHHRNGGPECGIITVSIGMDEKRPHSYLGRYVNFDKFHMGMMAWKEQWESCLLVNGGWEEQAEASKVDWLWHIITFPWNFMFCMVPPTTFFNGWGCFTGCLILIAVITAIISDLAELFGCVMGVPDATTAITFVAFGTSMPDLFASLAAAKMDPTADAAIVNVTGSNCVNVFLGLGGPWTLAAIYWSMQARDSPIGVEWSKRFPEMAKIVGPDRCNFVVGSQNLGFSVLMFGSAFTVAIIILIARRKLVGAELGGPVCLKWFCFVCFIFMWAGWVFIVTWRILRYDHMDMVEQLMMLGLVGSLESIVAMGCFGAIVFHWRRNPHVEQVDDSDIPVATSRNLTDAEAADAPFQVRSMRSFQRSCSLSADSWNSAITKLDSESRRAERRPSFVMLRTKTRDSHDSSASSLCSIVESIIQSSEEDPTYNNSPPNALQGLRSEATCLDPNAPVVTLIDAECAACELESFDFPAEHELPPVPLSMHLQTISHSDVVISRSDSYGNDCASIEYGGNPCDGCCTPRNTICTPRQDTKR